MITNLRNKLRGFLAVIKFENSWQLVMSRLLFQSRLDIYHFRGLDILVDHQGGDANGVRECLITDMYRKYVTQMNLTLAGASIVDIGANAGGFLLLLRSEGIIPKNIVAVELNQNTCKRLTFNVGRNFPTTNITILNEGVAGNAGEAVVYLGAGSSGDSLFALAPISSNSAATRVKLSTLDLVIETQFGDGTVDLCKIDIEGSEWDIFFANCCSRIKQCKNVLIEIHVRVGRTTIEMIQQFEGLGFLLKPRLAQDDIYWFVRVEENLSVFK